MYKRQVKKGTIFEKEISEMIINGKDTVTVLDIDELKGHTGSAFHGILVSTGKMCIRDRRNTTGVTCDRR